MESFGDFFKKFSVEDVEKLKVLMSFSTNEKEPVTLRVFVDEYLLLIKNNRSLSYYRSVLISLNYLTDYFTKQKTINAITLREIESFIIYLKQKAEKGYFVYYRNLKAAFNKAVEWGYISENYFTKIKLPKRQKVKPAFINSTQLSAISEQIKSNVVKDVVVFGFYSGLRLNEIVNLKWKNVNLETRIITVGDEDFQTKGRSQRFVPICEEVIELLERRLENSGRRMIKYESNLALQLKEVNPHLYPLNGRKNNPPLNPLPGGDNKYYVFCKSDGKKFSGDYLSKKFKKACIKAGIDPAVHFHSLRHSFASDLAQKGISLYVIKELLGHSSVFTTEIYSHLNIETLRDAVSRLEPPPKSYLQGREFLTTHKLNKNLRLIVNNKKGG